MGRGEKGQAAKPDFKIANDGVPQMFDLTGKTALVTGSGQGVGLGIARTLIEAGATVYVNDLVS